MHQNGTLRSDRRASRSEKSMPSSETHLSSEEVDKDAAGGEPDKRPRRGHEPAQTLHVRCQPRPLDAVPRDARVDSHVRDRHPRHHPHQAQQRRRHRQPLERRHYERRRQPENACRY